MYAVNADGSGTLSNTISDVIPSTVPDAPEISSVIAGNSSALISWTLPSDNGSPITYYKILYTDTSGNHFDSSANAIDTSLNIIDLSNGYNYSFNMYAVNGDGSGNLSNTLSNIIPFGVPSVPINFTANDISNTSITVSWSSPSQCTDICGYVLLYNGSHNTNVSATTFSYTYTNLLSSTNYTLGVYAYNNDGSGSIATINETTTAYITTDILITNQENYTIIINGTPETFIPQDISHNIPNGNFIVTSDHNFYTSETLVTYIDKDVSGNIGLINNVINSYNTNISNVIIKNSETGSTLVQKGIIGIFDHSTNLIISDLSNNEIQMRIADVSANYQRIGVLTIKEPSALDLSNGIVSQFYFKVIDLSTNLFVTNGFNIPFWTDLFNSKSTTETLGILRYDTSNNIFVKVADATLQTNHIYDFNLTTNSQYIIQQLVPDPPTITSIDQSSNYVHVHFTPPIFTGPSGELITQYKAYWSPSNHLQPKTVNIADISNHTIMIPSLLVGTQYTITLTAINIDGESSSSNSMTYTPTGSGGGVTGDPHITTIYNEQYLLPHVNGRFLLFDNQKSGYSLYITTDCYFLTPNEIDKAPFNSKYLVDYTFMKTVNIKFKSENIIINMNTLDILYKNIPGIIVEPIYNDKMAIGKYYSNNRIKELGNLLNFDGKSRKIHLIHKDIRYTITVSVDLNCADHRNDIKIEGPNMKTGRGAIISPNQALKLMNL